jgi:hypothetical protein
MSVAQSIPQSILQGQMVSTLCKGVATGCSASNFKNLKAVASGRRLSTLPDSLLRSFRGLSTTTVTVSFTFTGLLSTFGATSLTVIASQASTKLETSLSANLQTAGYTAAIIGHVSTSAVNTFSPTPHPHRSVPETTLNIGAIVGGVVGAVVGLMLIIGLVWYFIVKVKVQPQQKEPVSVEIPQILSASRAIPVNSNTRKTALL